MTTYTLLWSEKSKTFHIDELHQTVEHGQRSFLGGSPPDYIIVGTANSLEELRAIKEELCEARPRWHEDAQQE